VRDLPVNELQDILQRQGAEIGRTLDPPDQAVIEEIGQLPLEEPPTTGDRDDVSDGADAWLKPPAAESSTEHRQKGG
jgi:hypothetical protein